MHQRLPIALLGLGAISVATAYGLAFGEVTGALGPWCLAFGAMLTLAGLGLLGAGPRAPRLQAAVLLACSFTFAGFALALAAAAPEAAGPMLLGLPRSTAVLLLLAGAVPLILLPLAYAWAFPREVDRADTASRD
ncbi:MAG: hypothetical protein KF709_08545 [Gemmatimonadaceae bacterium]|nr:hypothetical protein [Gemmatimonadaceae bacterium]